MPATSSKTIRSLEPEQSAKKDREKKGERQNVKRKKRMVIPGATGGLLYSSGESAASQSPDWAWRLTGYLSLDQPFLEPAAVVEHCEVHLNEARD